MAEVLTPGVGISAAGGTVSLLFAGVLMFRGELEVGPAVLWLTAFVVGGGSLLAGRLAWRARKKPPRTGHQALLGQEAVVRRAEGDAGQVLLDGAWWTVRGRDTDLAEGQHVRVVDHDGLELIVEPVEPAQGHGTEQEDRP